MELKTDQSAIHNNIFNGNNELTCHKQYLPYQLNGHLMYGSILRYGTGSKFMYKLKRKKLRELSLLYGNKCLACRYQGL
jgi:hypothetical protein